MDAALGWFGAVIEWFGKFFPRWSLIRANEQAIKYLPRGRTKVIKPGIVWFWPVTTEVDKHPVCRQVLNTQSQTLMTKDGKSVYVSGIVIYSISDLRKYLVENWETEQNLDDVIQTAIRSVVVSKTVEEIQTHREELDRMLTKEARRLLRAFGAVGEAARLTNFSVTRVTNLVGASLSNVTVENN